MGVRWPVEPGLEDIICEWLKLLPSDEEWLKADDPPKDVTIDWWCCPSNWSRGGEIGSDFIFTGTGDDDEGGGVLFDTAKWGIPLKFQKLFALNHILSSHHSYIPRVL